MKVNLNMARFISVIIPLYNKENSIFNTIESVLNQTYKNFEILVVDDGSTDNSANIVKSIDDDRIKYIYKKNGGVSSARNRGVIEAKGEWILFLDADDCLYHKCLEVLINPSLKNDKLDISTARFYIEKSGVRVLNTRYSYEGIVPSNYKWMFLERYSLRTGCCIIRKKILTKYGFDERLSRFEDMKSILEWIRNAKIYVSKSPVMSYLTDNSSLSGLSKDLKKDFTFSMSFDGKTFWEKCILGKILYIGWIGYRNEHLFLKRLYFKNFKYMYLAKLQMILKHFYS